MNPNRLSAPLAVLLIGDLLVLVLGTLIGFASHGELSTSFVPRVFATLLPMMAAWALAAACLGLFRLSVTGKASQLWRPLLAMALAAPLAGVLRGIALGVSVLPIFVLVLAATFGLGFELWRFLFWLWIRKQVRNG